MATVRGYVIQEADGEYLSKTYSWFPHEKIEEAWVHPTSNLESILTHSKNWGAKPVKFTPAVYDDKLGVYPYAQIADVTGLSIEDALNVIRSKTIKRK